MPPFVEGHILDGMGSNWDVRLPAPTPTHSKAIDGIRDLCDLGQCVDAGGLPKGCQGPTRRWARNTRRAICQAGTAMNR